MIVTQSAIRHGWSQADILWAVEHSLVTVSVATRQPEGVMGLLHLGPARDGRILEVVTIVDDLGDEQIRDFFAFLRRSQPVAD